MMLHKYEPLEEMLQQLEMLDRYQALLQAQSYLAYRYAQWCDETFAELDGRRSQLDQIMREWEEASRLYNPPGGQ